MKIIKRVLLWYHTFHKRFFLKKGFIVLIALVPLVGLLLGITASMDGGMLTVYLAREGDDAKAAEIVSGLLEEKGIIRFVESTPKDAREAVRLGKADEAWIFKADFGERLESFAHRQSTSNALVMVIQREEGIAQMLAREKLCGALYPYLSHSFYVSYVKEEISADIPIETVEKYYDRVMPEGAELFDFSFTGDSGNAKGGYLTAPLRGLLSVMVVLAGLAVSMFYKMDEEKGIFIGIDHRFVPLFSFGYHFSAVIDVGLAMILSLAFSGVSVGLGRELLMLFIFAVITVLFCMALERICVKLGALAALTPLLVIGMIVICPVFFNFKFLRFIQALFPPYYYLEMAAGGDNLLSLLIYALALVAINAVLFIFSREDRNLS